MGGATVLVVEDEALLRWSVAERLREAGYTVLEAGTASAALDQARNAGPDLILLDQGLPDGRGVDLIAPLRELDPDAVLIMLTADARVETAVAAMRAGAHDYLGKPVNFEQLRLVVRKAAEAVVLKRRVRALKAGQAAPYTFDSIIGDSPAMRRVKQLLARVARSSSSTVLITGPSGTGKDLAAKVLHYCGPRADRPFMNITCSALPETLLESELFGHEKGAFTDARQGRKGLLEQAEGGTVFLDEIGEMSPALQAKLLRFLEEKTFRRVGGNTDIKSDVRIIAATNRNLPEAIAAHQFREDLYYRLNVITIDLPPLRERAGDVPLLVHHYIGHFCREFAKPPGEISAGALQLLQACAWPGNVRELRNVVERAVLLSDRRTLEPEDFQALALQGPIEGGIRLPPGGIHFEELERDLVLQALDRAGGNQTRAADLLGMNRDQIRYRIEKFGIRDRQLGTGDR
jgi:DNA-binding NtrC family response regulator